MAPPLVACSYHQEKLGGVWGTVRQSSVKTTDVAVEDIPKLRPWLRTLLHTRLFPMVVRRTVATGCRK